MTKRKIAIFTANAMGLPKWELQKKFKKENIPFARHTHALELSTTTYLFVGVRERNLNTFFKKHHALDRIYVSQELLETAFLHHYKDIMNSAISANKGSIHVVPSTFDIDLLFYEQSVDSDKSRMYFLLQNDGKEIEGVHFKKFSDVQNESIRLSKIRIEQLRDELKREEQLLKELENTCF